MGTFLATEYILLTNPVGRRDETSQICHMFDNHAYSVISRCRRTINVWTGWMRPPARIVVVQPISSLFLSVIVDHRIDAALSHPNVLLYTSGLLRRGCMEIGLKERSASIAAQCSLTRCLVGDLGPFITSLFSAFSKPPSLYEYLVYRHACQQLVQMDVPLCKEFEAKLPAVSLLADAPAKNAALHGRSKHVRAPSTFDLGSWILDLLGKRSWNRVL